MALFPTRLCSLTIVAQAPSTFLLKAKQLYEMILVGEHSQACNGLFLINEGACCWPFCKQVACHSCLRVLFGSQATCGSLPLHW